MRHPVRSKEGVITVAVDTRGGLASGAPWTSQGLVSRRAPVDLPSSVERLAVLLVSLAIAKADKRAGRTPVKTPKAIKDQIMRLRRSMLALGPEGAELAMAVTHALAGQGGRFLRTAERASTDLRPYIERAATFLASFVLNGMRVPAALVRAGSSAMNEAVADMLRDQLVALDPTAAISATKSRTIDGARVTNVLPTFDAVWKMYQAASTQAGKDAALAIHLEGWGREQEREQERRWTEQRWQLARTARPTNDERTPEAHERTPEAQLVDDDDQNDGGDSGHDSPPASGEHGARTGGDSTLSTPPVRADDSEADDDTEAPHNATSRDGEASPELTVLALEPGAFCAKRGRMVPASLAGTPVPSAASGAGWPERLKAENERITEWARQNERAQMSAALKRSERS